MHPKPGMLSRSGLWCRVKAVKGSWSRASGAGFRVYGSGYLLEGHGSIVKFVFAVKDSRPILGPAVMYTCRPVISTFPFP